MAEIEIESREKVKRLLRQLFQFDTQDLDFGIYRIMNFKRKEIEKFIEDDLINTAETEFREYAKASMSGLQEEVERLRAEINRDFGEGTIDEQGKVRKHKDAPKIEEYLLKMKDLESTKITQAQIEAVFNHVYEFFSRYYDKGDFLSKRRYGGREKYYVPYNGEEVLFHWATRDQYYVKTDKYFRRLKFKAGGYRVNFVLKEAETPPNNIKTGDRYFLLSSKGTFKLDAENKELDIFFDYRELTDDEKKKYRGRNVQETIISHMVNKLLSEIGDKGPGIELRRKLDQDKTLLEKRIVKYVKRNTTDYFIHKNLKSFLERELEFYLKNEVLHLDEIEHMDERNISINNAKLRTIRGISNKIIEFLAQIEGFQRRLFEKKKFVLRADYCMTLDYVPKEFYKETGENELQVSEWKKLFKLDETTKDTFESSVGKKTLDVKFLRSHKGLVLDTQFFSEKFKDRLLASFDHLDQKIGGLIIKSENFQALKLLLAKYESRIKFIYLDPPYNTGEDEFLYKDNYQRSSWLSMMKDRLVISKRFLQKNGAIFVSIDDNEVHSLRKMMDVIFRDENLLAQLVWNLGTGTQAGHFTRSHEYILVYAKDKGNLRYFRSTDDTPIKHGALKRISKDNPASEITFPAGMEFEGKNAIFEGEIGGEEKEIIVNGKMVFEKGHLKKPVTLRAGWAMRNQILSWLAGEETYDSKGQKVVRFFFNSRGILWYEKERDTFHPKTVLTNIAKTKDGTTEIEALFGKRVMKFPKPTALIEYLANTVTERNATVFDFFAGSGTTGHAILKLNAQDGASRRYLLVEMADHFENILKPRIQKLMYSREWKEGRPTSNEGTSHMFKYMYLEQYEDTLNNILFRSVDKTVQETLYSFKDYLIRYMLDYETKDSPTRLMVDNFQTPFDYKIKVGKTGENGEFMTVDLVETFNYLLGLDVERIRVFKDGDRTYKVIFGKKGNSNIVVIWRNTTDLDLEEDKKFIEEAVLTGNEPNLIFINGDSYVKNAKAIEPEFKKLMAGA